MEPKKRITLRELTALTGLSRTTIYNVLNNKGNFSEDTRTRVLDAMEQYDYRPNLNARNLALRREYLVGYVGIASAQMAYYNRDVQRGLARGLARFEDDGLCLLNKTVSVDEPDEWKQTVLALEESGVHSFILFPRSDREIDELVQSLAARGNTVVLLSNRLQTEDILAYAGCDYYQSGRICAQLIEKMSPKGGHVQVILNHVDDNDSSTADRYRGFLDQLGASQKRLKLCSPLYLNEQENPEQAVFRALANPALCAAADIIADLPLACRALHAAKREQETVLVGFDLYGELLGDLRDGTIDALINQGLDSQAELALEVLFRYLCYGETPVCKEYFSNLDIVMSSNVSYFYQDEE